MQFGSLTLKPCKYGWMLFRGPFIGKCFDLYGEYSESEVAMMRHFVQPGDTVIDVGANIGDLTIPLAKMVGPAGRVYAVESHPETFQILCANLALNEMRHVKPINAFIATTADIETAGPWGKFAFVSETWPPQFLSLDALKLASCQLLKIDVDGKELEVLKSGEALLQSCRPVLYFENDRRDLSPSLLGYVSEREYDLYWHPAPIFAKDNFFGNPVNHWAPKNVLSLMMLAVPRERKMSVTGLERVRDVNDWWKLK